jgi:hypothetical protein
MGSTARAASSSRLSVHCAQLRDLASNEPSLREPSVRPSSAREWLSYEVSLCEQPSHESECGESGPDRSSPDRLLAGRGLRFGFPGRGRSRTCGRGRTLALRRASAPFLNCKFATPNQLFGGYAMAGPNWCGVSWPFVGMVDAIASAESQEAVAGGAGWVPFPVPKQQSGDSGGWDVLNGARA